MNYVNEDGSEHEDGSEERNTKYDEYADTELEPEIITEDFPFNG